MKEIRLTNSYAITLILFLSIVSCQKQQNKDFFYTYIQSDPGKLDPFYSTDVISGRILGKMFNGLFRIDKDGKLKKDLVENFSFDGKILRASIKKNVFFHNGLILKSDDLIFSFKRIGQSKNPTSPRKWVFANIKTIIKINDYKFKIKLKKPSSTFLYLLTMANCYIISKKTFLEEGSIIGSGPFFLNEWKRDEEIILQRNPVYFGSISKIKGIIFRIIPEDLTARFEFLNGTIDYFELPYLANINFMKDVKYKEKAIRILDVPELSVHYIALNTTGHPFNNKRFRRALNMAIDRNKIMKSLFNKRFEKAAGPVPPIIGEYRATKGPIAYKPSKAREIINSLNLNNKEFVIAIKSDHQVSLISQMIQYFLQKAGLNIKIQEMEWSALKSAVLKKNYHMAYFTWHADYPEAENFLYPLFFSKNRGAGGNRSFYVNEKVDHLLLKAVETVNKEKRFAIYNKIERIIVDDAPWIFLWYGDKRIALSERVKKFVPYPIYNGMKGNEIEF